MTRLFIILTLFVTLFTVDTTQAATVYTPAQHALYIAVDNLAWYGKVNTPLPVNMTLIPSHVQNAMARLQRIGNDLGAWPKPYNGTMQQNMPFTIYLTILNDDGDYLNDYLTHTPVKSRRAEIVKYAKIVHDYGVSINMPYW